MLEMRQDERGWVVDPIVRSPKGEPLGHAHIASLEPGAVRGNHVHPDGAEYVLVWGGRAEIVWEEDGGIRREEVGGEGLVVFEIPAGVAHAVANTGDRRVYLLAYYFGAPGKEWPDTVRRPLVGA